MESFSDRGEYSFEVQVWPDVLLEQVFPALFWDSIDCQGESKQGKVESSSFKFVGKLEPEINASGPACLVFPDRTP